MTILRDLGIEAGKSAPPAVLSDLTMNQVAAILTCVYVTLQAGIKLLPAIEDFVASLPVLVWP